MRTLSLAALLAIASPLVAHDYWCLNHHFNVYADYGYIRRQDVRDLSLVKRGESGTRSKTIIDNEDLEKRLHWESAIRGGIIYNVDACTSWEATYTYFYPWTAKTSATGDDNLFFPFKDPTFGDDYRDASRVIASYDSRLQNGEFLYWWHKTPQRVDYFSFSWTVGFRYIYLREKLRLLFFRETDISPYKIDTFSDLYGAQLGAMLQINPSCCWTWTFMIKGAGFFDVAKNEVEIRDQDDRIKIRDYKKNKWTDSWLLEGYGQLAYHWGSCFSLHFGYQGYILTGVVLAPNQRDIARTEHRRINAKGQIVIDGLYAGMDFSF